MGKSLVAGSGTWSIPNYGGVRTAFQRKRRVAALKTATLFSRTITPLIADRELREIRYGVVVHTRENSLLKKEIWA